MKANAGEVYTVYNQYLKCYTACQVAYIAPPDTVSKESWAVILSLDWVGDAPLTAEELPRLRPLYKDFMYWSRDLHLRRVPVEIPPQYTLVGTLPPFTDQRWNWRRSLAFLKSSARNGTRICWSFCGAIPSSVN